MAASSPPLSVPELNLDFGAGTAGPASEPHPAGHVRHGVFVQSLRALVFTTYWHMAVFSIHATQLLGSPLYFINRDYYYGYMALTKQSFGTFITTITAWFSPTVVRVSGDKSMRGQLHLTADGRLETEFPERLTLIANHQIYTDWLYLWWIAYTSRMHGHVYIILKESLKYIPVVGPGMIFYGFVFMARNWAKDKSRLQHRLQLLNKGSHAGPLSGSKSLDPMWLLIFPEGTNLSANTLERSQSWADKIGIENLRHAVLPRSTGLHFALEQLQETVHWVYDCTVAYEGVPRGKFGQDLFTLRSTYFQGRPPKSVNMYWRRFATSSIPIHDSKMFEEWIIKRWQEKDELLEYFIQNGRFPADDGQDSKASVDGTAAPKGAGFIETEVKLAHWYEVVQIFVVLIGFGLSSFVLAMAWNFLIYGNARGAAYKE